MLHTANLDDGTRDLDLERTRSAIACDQQRDDGAGRSLDALNNLPQAQPCCQGIVDPQNLVAWLNAGSLCRTAGERCDDYDLRVPRVLHVGAAYRAAYACDILHGGWLHIRLPQCDLRTDPTEVTFVLLEKGAVFLGAQKARVTVLIWISPQHGQHSSHRTVGELALIPDGGQILTAQM